MLVFIAVAVFFLFVGKADVEVGKQKRLAKQLR